MHLLQVFRMSVKVTDTTSRSQLREVSLKEPPGSQLYGITRIQLKGRTRNQLKGRTKMPWWKGNSREDYHRWASMLVLQMHITLSQWYISDIIYLIQNSCVLLRKELISLHQCNYEPLVHHQYSLNFLTHKGYSCIRRLACFSMVHNAQFTVGSYACKQNRTSSLWFGKTNPVSALTRKRLCWIKAAA